jgi:hypothetical protein
MPVSYFYSFDKEDLRRDVTCALYQINTDFVKEFVSRPTNIAQGKWSRHFLDTPPGPSTAKGTGINWPMLRYADVLLMFAEAENELNGPTAAAQQALRRVRQRAFDPSDWNDNVDIYLARVGSDKQSFFEAIVDERAWEFGGEMIRKYELIRWNLYSEKVAETVETLKKMTDAAYSGTGEYSNLPDYIYWKVDESGNFVLLNPDEKIAAPPDDSWNRQSFLLSMYDENTGTYDQWVTRDWARYIDQGPKPGVVRYIFPIPAEAITNSQGTLANDGYSF